MTVLVAGCGDLGSETGLRFAAAGYHVVGMRRTPERVPEPIEPLTVDLTHQVPTIPADTQIVIVAASADQRTESAYRATYLDGLENLLDGVRRSRRLPRVLLVSSTAVYGDCGGAWIDEKTPANPAAATAAVLRQAEQLLLQELPGSIVLRLSGLYGPGRTRLIDRVRDGTARVGPGPMQFTNRIHRDDAAAAIVHLTTASDEPGSLYLGSDHEPTPRGEVERFLADELDVDPPDARVNGSMIRAGKRCRNDRLLATGFQFTYPTYREGYRAVLAGLGKRHP